jgi:hypothetical protein
MARWKAPSPIVFFRCSEYLYPSGVCELEVWPDTAPEVWLRQIEELLECARILGANSDVIRDLALHLGEVFAELRCESMWLDEQLRTKLWN